MARVPEEVRRLAREINSIKRELRNATLLPQLGRASLDDESINTYDSDGNLRARYGFQHDGTYTTAVLDGPVPPVPSAPVVEGGPGELTVAWDGTYVDDRRAPMDFHVVEVWAAEDDFSDRSEARLLGHFSNESGGDITVARPVGEWHVALVSKAQSGRRSAVSERAIAEVTSVVDQETIDELNDRLEDLPSVTWSPDAPTTADGDGKPDDAVWRQVDAETDAITGEWTWDESAGEWVARPIADDAIYSLDVAKLFASELGVDTLVAEEIWASKIAASKIDAEEINTQSLGADQGFIGVLNSAEIVGAVIKTADDGARVELDSGHGIRIFNEDDDLVLSADADGNLISSNNEENTVRISPGGIDLLTSGFGLVKEISVNQVPVNIIVKNDKIYVGRGNVPIEMYDLDGKLLKTWDLGAYPDSTRFCEYDNRFYVLSDPSSLTSNKLVQVFDEDGVKQTEISLEENGYGIDIHDGYMYVTQISAGEVNVYSLSGNKQTTWSTGTTPTDLQIYENKAYINIGAQASNRSIEIYDLSGNKQNEIIPEHSFEKFRVHQDLIYLTARSERRVEVYGLDGGKQDEWDLEGKGWGIYVYDDSVFVGNQYLAVEVYEEHFGEKISASLNAETGRLETLSADMRGVTRVEAMTARQVMPRARLDGESYPASVEIVRPAFTHGYNIFVDEDHRDLDLPDPPDGTTAWTGERDNLVEWLRVGDEWVRQTPLRFEGSDIFQTVESGVSISSSSRATVTADGTCNIYIAVSNLAVTNGVQNTRIGTIRDELHPPYGVPLPGYYTNGAVMGAITGGGVASIRWSTGAVSSQKFLNTTYPVADD